MKNAILAIFILLSVVSAKKSIAGEVALNIHPQDSLSTKSTFKIIRPVRASDTLNDYFGKNPVNYIENEANSTFTLVNDCTETVKEKRPIAVKTNLLYWVAATPNLSVEFYLSNWLSLSTEFDFAWWSNRTTQFYWQLFSVSPELRYWFCDDRHFQGHYAGIYVGAGLYDIMLKPITGHKGYQGDFFVSAGLSYGYMFPIGKHLSLEAGVSVGYMQTSYREYVWECYKYMRTDTKRTTWIGPTKINLTFLWRIPR